MNFQTLFTCTGTPYVTDRSRACLEERKARDIIWVCRGSESCRHIQHCSRRSVAIMSEAADYWVSVVKGIVPHVDSALIYCFILLTLLGRKSCLWNVINNWTYWSLCSFMCFYIWFDMKRCLHIVNLWICILIILFKAFAQEALCSYSKQIISSNYRSNH